MRLFRHSPSIPASLDLAGDRVYLRPPGERDWRAYAELRAQSRAFLEPWEPTWPENALSHDAFARRLKRYASDWREDAGYGLLVFRRRDHALLGGIALSHVRRGVAQCGTLGYWVGAPYARRGYMSDALAVMLGFSFDRLALHRVEAACLPQNEPSRRLLQRAGFEQEGFARKYLKIRGQWHDHLLFGLVAESYAAHRQARRAAE